MMEIEEEETQEHVESQAAEEQPISKLARLYKNRVKILADVP